MLSLYNHNDANDKQKIYLIFNIIFDANYFNRFWIFNTFNTLYPDLAYIRIGRKKNLNERSIND